MEKPAPKFTVSVPVKGSTTGDAAPPEVSVAFSYYYCQDAETGVCKVGSVVFVVQNVAPREVIFSSGRAQEFQSVAFAARLPTENIKPLLSSDLPLPQARSVRK